MSRDLCWPLLDMRCEQEVNLSQGTEIFEDVFYSSITMPILSNTGVKRNLKGMKED